MTERIGRRLIAFSAHPRVVAIVFASLFVMIVGIAWPPLAYAMLVPAGAYLVVCIAAVLLMLWAESA